MFHEISTEEGPVKLPVANAAIQLDSQAMPPPTVLVYLALVLGQSPCIQQLL